MKVRLCSKLCAKHGLVHDAPGEVVGFQFHPKEDLSWRRPGSDASKTGYHLLRYLPEAVLVKFAVDEDFGFGEPGVVAVAPGWVGWAEMTHTHIYLYKR